MLRACIVQGSQQIWVAALWYWGFQLQNASVGSLAPWWIVLIVWPLSAMSFLFAYLMLYGLPGKQFLTRTVITIGSHFDTEYYRQTPPKVPGFIRTLTRRKLVLWFLASELLRDYWLSGVSLG
jgi:alpha-1,3-glucan synthase